MTIVPVTIRKAISDKGMSQRQHTLDGMAVYLARNKTAKELDELMAVAESNEQKAVVRFARKLKRDWR